MIHTELSNIITYNPWSIEGQTTLGELVELLPIAEFHHWPVVDDERQLIGMLCSSDLVRIFEAGATALTLSDERREERLEIIRCQHVSEVMSPRVLSIQQNESPASALWTLLEHRVSALPVLTDSYLTALATTSDFLREFSYGGSLAGCISVSETMQSPSEPVESDATLDDVAMAMHFTQSDAVPIVRGGLPLGVVSRRDLGMLKLRQTLREVFGSEALRAEPQGNNSTSILALAASAPTIRPGERLSCAAHSMIEHRRQAIAVVNQAGRLLGVVTEEMILRAMLDEMRS
ncbi:MAG: CBS domain-containing protein [Planctomycetaceae bacterium]|nr:CBS domain-containing protein [Planctomycetales bacterium]MCB9873888.1 CBS domain-containing protein [Planctomycetaceae bacterium]MCB9937418.1 CBS domain-containing protein [Planctomycetaceae bacterium]